MSEVAESGTDAPMTESEREAQRPTGKTGRTGMKGAGRGNTAKGRKEGTAARTPGKSRAGGMGQGGDGEDPNWNPWDPLRSEDLEEEEEEEEQVEEDPDTLAGPSDP